MPAGPTTTTSAPQICTDFYNSEAFRKGKL